MRAASCLLAGALALAACGPRDADARIARAREETRALSESFDRLEERLLANQARVHMWQELRRRHESVTAIACVSQEEHAAEMAMRSLTPALVEEDESRLPPTRVAAMGPAKPLIRESWPR